MARKLSFFIPFILLTLLLAACQPGTQTGGQNGGRGNGGSGGNQGFQGTRNPLRLTQRAEGTTFPSGGGQGFNGTPNPLRQTQRAEGTTFPFGGGQGGFGQAQGSPTPTPPPLETGTPTLPVTPARPTNQLGLLSPGQQPIISAIRMFTANAGWAIGTGPIDINDHILRTQDGGASWIDTTPPEPFDTAMALRKQATAFFADPGHAWVTFQYMGGPPTAPIPLVWYTADGGETWAKSSSLDIGQGGDFYAPGNIQFVDLLHGWLLVHVGKAMSHDYVFIFSTQDGGKTWQRIVDPWLDNLDMSCTKTGLTFADAKNGLATGDCNGVVTNSVYLYRTSDGGNTWQKVYLRAAAGLPDMFTNESNVCGTYNPGFSGQFAWVTVQCNAYDPGVEKTFLYTSDDYGQIWGSHAIPASAVDFVQFLNPGKGWFAGNGRVYQSGDSGVTWSPVSGLGGEGQLNFIDQKTGWMVARTGDSIRLVVTTDGGATWNPVNSIIR